MPIIAANETEVLHELSRTTEHLVPRQRWRLERDNARACETKKGSSQQTCVLVDFPVEDGVAAAESS
jgi:hypothetical protein